MIERDYDGEAGHVSIVPPDPTTASGRLHCVFVVVNSTALRDCPSLRFLAQDKDGPSKGGFLNNRLCS